MSNFSAMTITDIGKKIAADFVRGQTPLNFSKFALGSGKIGSENKAGLIDLLDWKQDIGIATIVKDTAGSTITIRGNYTNAGVIEPYSATELGLYVLNPDTGTSVLFGYFTDSLPDTVPSESLRAITDTIAVTILVSGSENITATFDGGELATIQDIEDRRLKISDIYPVGSIYMSIGSTDPGELFSGTTWKKLPAGRMLLAAGTSDSGSEYISGATGGEEKHKLTIDEMPAHSHKISSVGDHKHIDPYGEAYPGPFGQASGTGHLGSGDSDSDNYLYWTSPAGAHTHTIGKAGGSAAFSNLPPYLVVNMWQRTA